MRMALSLAVWALAGLGVLRRLRRGAWDLTYVLLAIAPFLLLVLQAYGGEMRLRAYLFALPAMVFFMAAFFYIEPAAGISWYTTVAIGLTSLLLLGGFLFARYGNERMDYVTSNDVQGMDHLYSIAKPGSVFLTLAPWAPLQFKDFEKYDLDTVVHGPPSPGLQAYMNRGDTSFVTRKMLSFCPRTSYLIVTRSSEAEMELLFGVSPTEITRLNQGLMASRSLAPIFDNGDVRIFVLGSCRAGQ
jgi:hypothetical protein